MSIELLSIDMLLVGLFQPDAVLVPLIAGRAFADEAPQGSVFPYIVWNYMGGVDVTSLGPNRILTLPIIQIKVIDQGGSFARAKPIYERVDLLVTTFRNPIVDGMVISGAVRTQPIKYTETNANLPYKHLGGLYRFFVNKNSP